ncbi:RHS repeat-associated core domain-containing protein [Streptomyces sp. O3]
MQLKERRAQVAKDRFQSTVPAAGAKPEPTVSASAAPWGTPQFLIITGSEGSKRAQIGPKLGDTFKGQVFTGEKVVASTLIRNSDQKKKEGGGLRDWIDVQHRVKVTWSVQCAGHREDFDLGQEVMTHSGIWAYYNNPTDEPIVTFEATVDPEQCSGYFADPTFVIMVHATVVDVEGGGTGTHPADAHVLDAIPDGQTHGCADPCASSSTGFSQPQARRGTSVNTATGAFSEMFRDSAQPLSGGGLALTRSYSSNNAAAGSFGKGWTAPWDSHLTTSPEGHVTFVSENGSEYLYRKDGSTFIAPVTSRSTLKQLDSGGYTLATPRQQTLTFDADGRLTSSKDRTGQGIEYGYTDGRLTLITDSFDRVAKATYNGDLLTRVDFPDGRYTAYGYTGGRLTTVTALDQSKVHYGYDDEGRLNSVQDPNGNYSVRNSYDSQGRVVRQSDAAGEVTTFSYKGNETDTVAPDGGVWTDIHTGNILTAQYDPFGNKTFYNYDGRANVSRITDQLGNATDFSYDGSGHLTKTTTAEGASWKYTYDTDGNVEESTDPESNSTTYAYNSKNLLTSVTDALESAAEFSYTPVGRIASATGPLGRVTRYGYDSLGNQTSVTYPDGSRVTQEFDASGRVVALTDPRGNADGADPDAYTTSYTYDDGDRLLTRTDAKGRKFTRTYDAVGNLLTVTDAAGGTTSYIYDAANRLTEVKDPAGNTITQTYDAMGRLTSRTDAAGGKTTYRYDKAGRVTSMTPPRGNVSGADPEQYTWTYGYDKTGNQITATDPLGNTTATAYDADHRPISVTDPLGNTQKSKYDDMGNIVGTTDALGRTTVLTYDANNQLVSVKDRGRDTVMYGYDASGNLTSETSPLGNKTTYGYDVNGRLTKVVEPRGNTEGSDLTQYTWHTSYDQAGNVVSRTDPLGNKTTRAYDAVGNVVEHADARGKKTAYAYDALDRIMKITAPDGGVTTLGYDALGNMTSRKDANQHVTTYGYDKAGRLTEITDPLDRSTSYAYDADGNRAKVTNARGQTITSTFDARNLLTKTTYSDGTPTTSYAYNAAGQLKTITDGSGTRTLTYDAEGRPLTISSPGAAKPFKYAYNYNGTIKRRTYPDGRVTRYAYDADGRITGQTTNSKTTTYGWDAAGNLTSTKLPTTTARTETRTYDRAGRLASVSEDAGARHYTRDATGRVTSDTYKDLASTGLSTRYAYDDLGRLLRECTDTIATSSCLNGTTGSTYSYDQVGNLIKDADGKSTTTNTYDAADQLTKSTTGTSTTDFAYDADGNRTKDADGTYAHDALGRIKSATLGEDTFTFIYDADGNRTASHKNGDLARTSRWDVNNPLAQIATDTNAAGDLLADYHYNPHGIAQSMDRADGSFYFLHDRQDSVTSVQDSAGNKTYEYDYSAWGEATGKATVPDGQSSPFGYTGQYNDQELPGRLQLRARSYDPETKRFTTPDPIPTPADSPNSSPYAYVNNDPANLADPSGLCPWCFNVGIGALFGAVVEGGIYAWNSRDNGDFSWGGLAKASGKGALTGGIAGFLMPGSGNVVARGLGLTGGRAVATSTAVNAAVGTAFAYGVNKVNCRPTDPWDLVIGAAGGGSSSLIGPAFTWIRGLFPPRVQVSAHSGLSGNAFRALRDGESPTGIHRPGADPNVQPWSHVMGHDNSPWISLTRDPRIMYNIYGEGSGIAGRGSNGYIAVDLSRVTSDTVNAAAHLEVPDHIRDLGLELGETAFRDKEILVKFSLHGDAIFRYWPPGTSLDQIIRDIG